MKSTGKVRIKLKAAGAVCAGVLAYASAFAQSNVWITSVNANWGASSNWTLGSPVAGEDLFITNAPGKTVTVNGTTSTNTMTVGSLTVGSLTNTANTITVGGGALAPLQITNFLLVQKGGAISVSGSNGMQVDGLTTIGAASPFGAVLNTSAFTVSSGGFAKVSDMIVGETNASATLSITGTGKLLVLGNLTLAAQPLLSTGAVALSGTLIHTNGTILVGSYGVGSVIQAGGTNLAQGVQLGNGAGSQGTYVLSNSALLTCSTYIRVGSSGSGTLPCAFSVANTARLAVTNPAGTGSLEISKGSFTMSGGVVQVDSLLIDTTNGMFTNIGGTFKLTSPAQITNATVAFLSGTNTFLSDLNISSTLGSTATVSIASSVVNISSNFVAAPDTNSSVSITLSTNASVTVSNGTMYLGSGGAAQMTMLSGSFLSAPTIRLGGSNGVGSGDLITQPGSLLRFHFLSANYLGPGGDVDATGGTIVIGDDHAASMVVSGGTVTNMGFLAIGHHFDGTFLQTGGKTVVHTNLSVGDCDASSVGYPTVSGGTVYVTNIAHTAVMVVSNGTFLLNPGGSLVVDTLVLTNPCGHLLNDAGTGALQILVSANVDPNLSAAGDGIPNWWKQLYGFDLFASSVASADPDHDRMSNLAEYLAGTDPTNPNSNLRVTGVVVTNGTNVRVDWTTVAGRSYVVQTNGNLSSRAFVDRSAPVPAGAPGEGVTNYVHVGGATNPGTFYRVRLVTP